MSGGYIHPWPHLAPDGSAAAPSYAWATSLLSGFRWEGAAYTLHQIGGTPTHGFAAAILYCFSDLAAIHLGAAQDVCIYRDGAADTLAQRRGVNPQTFHVYNTWANAGVNYERCVIGWIGGNLTVGQEYGGTGAAQNMLLGASCLALYFKTANINRWCVNNAGHFVGAIDNVNDIGSEDATRPRNVISNSFQLEALANSGHVQFTRIPDLVTVAAAPFTDSAVAIPADAVILAVQAYVVTAIPGPAVNFTVTGSISGMVFNTAAIPVAAGSANAGTMAGHVRSAGEFIRITPNVAPGAATGQVRIVIFYMVSAPPTS